MKTHRKTGLKYLCKTIQDPYKYKGSGLYWKRHLKKHGSDIDTEVIKICSSHEEFKYWGVFYSNYYNILSAVDNYGNKIWANLKLEEGDGGGETFKINNPMKNPATLIKKYGENHNNHHMKDLRRRQNQSIRVSGPTSQLHTQEARVLKSGKNHYLHGMPSHVNPFYDHTIYKFINLKTNEIIEMTQNDFIKKFNASPGNVSQLVRGKPSPKSVKGWACVNGYRP